MRRRMSNGRSMVRVRVRRCRERRCGMRAIRVVNGMARTRSGKRRREVGWRRGMLCLLCFDCALGGWFFGYVVWLVVRRMEVCGG